MVFNSRLGIFIMYDKYGTVDDSVIYLLREARTVIIHLVVVCNGYIDKRGIEMLKKYADELYIRENIGYDAAAYIAAFSQFIGWNRLKDYNEVVMFNSTFFGPFSPFIEIFREMDKRSVDFWGLSRHGATTIVQPHLQSYFLVVRRRLLHSKTFRDFWETRNGELADISEVIKNFEVSFTQIFEKAGYTWKAYADTQEWESTDRVEKNFNPCVFLCKTVIEEFGLPILKKRLWPWTNAEKTLGYELRDALAYIDQYTNYDVNLIWRYMIRYMDINELRKALNLHFVLPQDVPMRRHIRKTTQKPAVLILVPDEKIAGMFCNGQLEIPDNCDRYFLTVSGKVGFVLEGNSIGEIRILQKEYKGAASSFLQMLEELCGKYSYMCFCTLQPICGNCTPEQLSYNYNIYENLLKSEQYVKNILFTFRSNKYLGVLCPPIPYHAENLCVVSNEWYYEYEEIERVIKALKLRCAYSVESETPTVGFSFWFRTKALKSILMSMDWLKDYAARNVLADIVLPRVIPYVAQHQGYYTAVVENMDFAGMHLEGNQHLLEMNYVHERRDEDLKQLLSFCRSYSELYIYGAGKFGGQALQLLKAHNIQPKGFVVSDDHYEENKRCSLEYPIYSLQQVEAQAGVLVALNFENAADAMRELEKRGMKNVHRWDGRRGGK